MACCVKKGKKKFQNEVRISCFLLLFFFLHQLVRGGLLYRAIPFSKDSLVQSFPFAFINVVLSLSFRLFQIFCKEQCYKTLFNLIHIFCYQARVSVAGKPLQLNLIFALVKHISLMIRSDTLVYW
jgi:hypothetical protein